MAYMRDKEILMYTLKKIRETILRIISNSEKIDSADYYLLSPAGMERL